MIRHLIDERIARRREEERQQSEAEYYAELEAREAAEMEKTK